MMAEHTRRPDNRPDPEQLLARLKIEPDMLDSARGKLKIYCGFAAGVGKTYAMLKDARTVAATGTDLACGYIEPHGRSETEALLDGQELLSCRTVTYRGVTLREFDLDGALMRKPTLILVDELAHTNAPGSRHAKRWQDVEELLDAGINVWTTLNVQHLESLNDVVAQITSVVVRETLPDSVFDQADELELVDLPPDELLERLREGKVYIPEQAKQAMQRFFKKANLIALREIAMRRTADRISTQVQTARLGETRTQTWPTNERLLVCIGPSPTSAKVIRTATRMAAAMHAQWIAVHVEIPDMQQMDEQAQRHLAAHMRLAEQLGAETVTLTGQDVVAEIIDYAQSCNVTKIVIGKTGQTQWYRVWRRSLVDRLIARSGDIDVYVIRGVEDQTPVGNPTITPSIDYRGYIQATAVMVAATAVAWAFHRVGLSDADLIMSLLLGVVYVAARLGRGPAIYASVVAVLLFNFLFTHPYLTFTVTDTKYIFTFGVMFVIGIMISTLTSRIKDQAELSRRRERHTEALYRLSRRLTGTLGIHQLVAVAEEQLSEIFGGEVVIFLPNDQQTLRPTLPYRRAFAESPNEVAVASWVYQRGRLAGVGTDTLPNAQALYLPLVGPEGTVGVLAIRPSQAERLATPEQRQLLETFASQIALALERDRLAEEAQRVLAQAQAEKLRSALLSSVSHDLRTPLAAIAGASSSLLTSSSLDDKTRRELLQMVYEEAERLSRLVENLLYMTRVESGHMTVHKQWQPLEEVIGTALERLSRHLSTHPVHVEMASDFPFVPFDGILLEQVLMNLLDNATKYAPAGTPIDILARIDAGEALVQVADRGPGLAAEDLGHVFEKFYRGAHTPSTASRGAGLGLAICRAIIQAHGGHIWAENRPGGGACFLFTLPLEGSPPTVETDGSKVLAEEGTKAS
jgi:two-component system, OmpR family, sensor histidine kinase KdpD